MDSPASHMEELFSEVTGGDADELTPETKPATETDQDAPVDTLDDKGDALKVEDNDATAPDGAGDDVAEKGESEDQAETPDVLDLAALAEQLGVDEKKVYDIEIPLGDERGSIKLGKLKDSYQDYARVEDEREALEFEKTELQNEVLRTRAEFAQMAKHVNVTPEARILASREQGQMVQRETAATLEVMPEWRDAAVLDADRNTMLAHTRAYGFDPAEMANLYDHRLVKYIRDASRQWARSAEAAKTLRTKRKTRPARKSNGRGEVSVNDAAKQKAVFDGAKGMHPRDAANHIAGLFT